MAEVSRPIRIAFCLLLTIALFRVPAASQQVSLDDASVSVAERVLPFQQSGASAPEISTHRFWDRENRVLFAAVAFSSAADFGATYANLNNGGRELNPITRLFSGSTAGLAFNFAGETAGVIGISYFFHKAGHHKLERIVSVVNVSASTGVVIYDVRHR